MDATVIELSNILKILSSYTRRRPTVKEMRKKRFYNRNKIVGHAKNATRKSRYYCRVHTILTNSLRYTNANEIDDVIKQGVKC